MLKYAVNFTFVAQMNKKLAVIAFIFFIVLVVLLAVFIGAFNLVPDDSLASTSEVNATVTNVQNYTCGPNAPSILTIARQVPIVVAPNQQFNVIYTVANCSDNNWRGSNNAGGIITKLGSQGPQDNLIWQAGRVNLDRNINRGQSANISFTVKAPQNPGSYVLQYGLVRENVAWIKPYLAPEIVLVSNNITACSALEAARNNPSIDATPLLQSCINNAPEHSVVSVRAGNYTLQTQLTINKAITITGPISGNNRQTCLLSDINCPRFIAHPNYPNRLSGSAAGNAMISINVPNYNDQRNSVTLLNLVVNGNKENRTKTNSACLLGATDNRLFNIVDLGTNKLAVFNTASINAPCGTALNLNGTSPIVAYSYFANNGTHGFTPGSTTSGTWADGVSANSRQPNIFRNVFYNNTDVDLILWGGKDGNVSYNRIVHDNDVGYAFAGLMLNTWDQDPVLQDFTNANVSHNRVICNGKCGFGIVLGERPWRPSARPIYGAEVHNNVVLGARQGIMVDGAGTNQSPITLRANRVRETVPANSASCGFTTNNISIAPDARVDLQSQTVDSRNAWRCALPSCAFNREFCGTPNVNKVTLFDLNSNIADTEE